MIDSAMDLLFNFLHRIRDFKMPLPRARDFELCLTERIAPASQGGCDIGERASRQRLAIANLEGVLHDRFHRQTKTDGFALGSKRKGQRLPRKTNLDLFRRQAFGRDGDWKKIGSCEATDCELRNRYFPDTQPVALSSSIATCSRMKPISGCANPERMAVSRTAKRHSVRSPLVEQR